MHDMSPLRDMYLRPYVARENLPKDFCRESSVSRLLIPIGSPCKTRIWFYILLHMIAANEIITLKGHPAFSTVLVQTHTGKLLFKNHTLFSTLSFSSW